MALNEYLLRFVIVFTCIGLLCWMVGFYQVVTADITPQFGDGDTSVENCNGIGFVFNNARHCVDDIDKESSAVFYCFKQNDKVYLY